MELSQHLGTIREPVAGLTREHPNDPGFVGARERASLVEAALAGEHTVYGDEQL